MKIRSSISKKLSNLPVALQLMKLLDFFYSLNKLSYLPASHRVVVVVYICRLFGYFSKPRLSNNDTFR